jgi:enoyl-CoA hydratase/carnithine racemase
VVTETHGATRHIVLNRPEKLNAINEDMIGKITAHLEAARVDPAVRCILLRGEGRAFCAGDELGRVIPESLGPPDVETKMKTSYVRPVVELMRLRKPSVAMLQGFALGAGLDIALACDFRIASSETEMGAPVVRWGLGGATAYLLTQYLGVGRATELLLLGDRIGAARAYELGLITTVVEPDQLEDAATTLTRRLEGAATASIGLIKGIRNKALGAGLAEGFEAQVRGSLELMLLEDPIEGRRAWKEKRNPSFSGAYRNLD